MMNKYKNKLVIVMCALLGACSARVVVQPAQSQLDPYPEEISVVVTAKADVLADKQWALAKIGAESTLVGEGNKRVTVGIFGTGVDYNHEDLRSQIKVNTKEFKDILVGGTKHENGIDEDGNGYIDDFIGYDFVENDGLPFDRNGAGTAMAGVVGAVQNNGKGIKGLMSKVSLVPVRFIDSSGHFLFPNLIKSLQYGLKTNLDVIILHMPNYILRTSPGDSADDVKHIERDILEGILSKIQKKGIPIIANSGNLASQKLSPNSMMATFAKFSNFLAVTSSDNKDIKPFIANAEMSYVSTAAPGDQIMTTLPGNRYGNISSTSMAAAHVGATVALGVGRRFGQISNEKLLKALLSPEASDIVAEFQFKTIGGNRLNLEKYLSYIETL